MNICSIFMTLKFQLILGWRQIEFHLRSTRSPAIRNPTDAVVSMAAARSAMKRSVILAGSDSPPMIAATASSKLSHAS